MRVPVSQTGCGPGGFREDFHQKVILELMLKHQNLPAGTNGISERSVQRQEVNEIMLSLRSCKV